MAPKIVQEPFKQAEDKDCREQIDIDALFSNCKVSKPNNDETKPINATTKPNENAIKPKSVSIDELFGIKSVSTKDPPKSGKSLILEELLPNLKPNPTVKKQEASNIPLKSNNNNSLKPQSMNKYSSKSLFMPNSVLVAKKSKEQKVNS